MPWISEVCPQLKGVREVKPIVHQSDVWWERPPGRDNIYRGREAAPTKYYSRVELEMELNSPFQTRTNKFIQVPIQQALRVADFHIMTMNNSQDDRHRTVSPFVKGGNSILKIVQRHIPHWCANP
jgi:hypothetical protein